jgi:hypothetical protein
MPDSYPHIPTADPKPVARMTPSDLEEMHTWLHSRLVHRHPHASPQQTKTWLQGVLTDNGHWFVRSGDAVALARIVRDPLEFQPRAEEMFVLNRGGTSSDAADLYAYMAKWALNQEARSLDVQRFSDVPVKDMEIRLGRPRARNVHTVRFA